MRATPSSPHQSRRSSFPQRQISQTTHLPPSCYKMQPTATSAQSFFSSLLPLPVSPIPRFPHSRFPDSRSLPATRLPLEFLPRPRYNISRWEQFSPNKEPWMARIFVAVFISAAILAGCQQQAEQNLPLPNLNGPVVLAPTPLPPPIEKPKPKPGSEPKTTARRADVPADWAPHVAPNKWLYIVIHHSATPAGSAAQFDRSHRQKGWDELGYHFVIGNGTGSRDGQIEVGPR